MREATGRIPAAWCVLLLFVASTGCVGIGGETIPIEHGPLDSAPLQFDDELSILRDAEDKRNVTSRIGRATITVFAITSGSVHSEKPIEQAVVRNVVETLESAGYHVQIEDPSFAAQAEWPQVRVQINRFHFKNYNWLWPIVPTWGDVDLTVRLMDSDGATLFDRSFSGGGTSFCLLGHCAFKAAVRRAMNEAMKEVLLAFTSEEFRIALGRGPEEEAASVPAAGGM